MPHTDATHPQNRLSGMIDRPVRVDLDDNTHTEEQHVDPITDAEPLTLETPEADAHADDHADAEHGSASEASRNGPRSTPPMRTLLARFCEQFDEAVRPVLAPVEEATTQLAATEVDLDAKRILPQLRDLAHQVQVLIDKVAQQQAYVLIFGPLKSGKSTFMNAMCAAYVSEVTCLPAYPCMVYVSHAEEPQFIVTRYSAQRETHTDQDKMHALVAEAHEKLNSRIQEVEARGEAFDPAIHMPEAIRRIDVKVPAGDLKQSGAVLVDTPGLYSRMKFGYDRMTRDFRDAAACAIFIVKTDNLFLEQVFNEFQELLDLFSRIFLIVNIDSTKKDLAPDGTLRPSLEHEDPSRIIQAFETLAMTGPLKEAADENRLEIYPVDLLGSASGRIRHAMGENGDITAEAGDADHHDTPQVRESFDRVLGELTDYLNSNDYLKAFLMDSLRRADTLMNEMSSVAQSDAVSSLDVSVERLETERDEANARVEAVRRLQMIDWRSKASDLQEALSDTARSRTAELEQHAIDRLSAALDGWFASDRSLKSLNEDDLTPLFRRTHEQMVRVVGEAMDRILSTRPGGLSLDTRTLDDLRVAGLDLTTLGRDLASPLKPGADAGRIHSDITTNNIPIGRRLMDWLMFRSQASMRRRVLGPPENPDLEIPQPVKERRLGQPAREAMQETGREQVRDMTSDASEKLPAQVANQYAAAIKERLAKDLDRLNKAADADRQRADQHLQEAQRLQGAVRRMRSQVADTREGVQELTIRFGEADPAALTQEVEAEESDGGDVVYVDATESREG